MARFASNGYPLGPPGMRPGPPRGPPPSQPGVPTPPPRPKPPPGAAPPNGVNSTYSSGKHPEDAVYGSSSSSSVYYAHMQQAHDAPSHMPQRATDQELRSLRLNTTAAPFTPQSSKQRGAAAGSDASASGLSIQGPPEMRPPSDALAGLNLSGASGSSGTNHALRSDPQLPDDRLPLDPFRMNSPPHAVGGGGGRSTFGPMPGHAVGHSAVSTGSLPGSGAGGLNGAVARHGLPINGRIESSSSSMLSKGLQVRPADGKAHTGAAASLNGMTSGGDNDAIGAGGVNGLHEGTDGLGEELIGGLLDDD